MAYLIRTEWDFADCLLIFLLISSGCSPNSHEFKNIIYLIKFIQTKNLNLLNLSPLIYIKFLLWTLKISQIKASNNPIAWYEDVKSPNRTCRHILKYKTKIFSQLYHESIVGDRISNPTPKSQLKLLDLDLCRPHNTAMIGTHHNCTTFPNHVFIHTHHRRSSQDAKSVWSIRVNHFKLFPFDCFKNRSWRFQSPMRRQQRDARFTMNKIF